MIARIIKYSLIFGVVLGLILSVVGGVVGAYFYIRLTRDLPKFDRLSDYRPKAVTSIYSDDGTLMAELYEERRYPVKFEEIPLRVRNAFLAAEDANFYSHPGIDITSIFRAMWVNLHHKSSKQGASTITQQIVKSLLLTREKTFERKAKEAILSYRIEKALTKDEILSIYLNEIFLGNTAYGIKAAGRVHFHKELNELTIAEAAFLAGLPQKPSYLMELAHRGEALQRQHYVLQQMLSKGMITAEERSAAEKEELKIFGVESRTFLAPYFVAHAETELAEKLQSLDKRLTPTNPGGFQVYTTADVKAHEIAERAVHRGLQEVDRRRGWRGPLGVVDKEGAIPVKFTSSITDKNQLKPFIVYPAQITEIQGGSVKVKLGELFGSFDLKKSTWANRFLTKDDRVTGIDIAKYLKVGQIIEVSLDLDNTKDLGELLPLRLSQTPLVEGAFVIANALTGEVKIIIGGYDYEKSQFNRATQGLRQPGSSFKPFIYLAAVDDLGFTPSTIVPDEPISLVAGNGQMWSPQNFDEKYLGPITLRTALQRSRNVVSVYLLNKMGVDKGIQYARKLGITTPIGRDLSISLGTSEVKLIELVHAYGTFAAGGWLSDSLVVSKIRDRDGKLLVEQRPKQKQVISEESAFIMASMMKGVVERGTATIVKELGKPTAGKTGTTNDHMDAWFIGYTPEWAGGAWVGFDVKRPMGKPETGGRAAAPIFLYFMQEFLKDTPPLDFEIPDGVIPVPIDLNSGRPVEAGTPGAFIEYFKSGTEPTRDSGASTPPGEYLSSQDF